MTFRSECRHLSDAITQKDAMCGSKRGTLVHDMREFNCLDCKAVYDEVAKDFFNGLKIRWDRPRDWTRDAEV